jgi:hypothetical protein
MKPKLNCAPVMTARSFAPPARRIVPAFSPQKSPRQAPLAGNFGSFSRPPALPANRPYLKAMRQAEMAAWESAPQKSHAPSTSRQVAPRLPSPVQDAREGWMYALLTALCAAALGNELWSAFQAAGNWQNFLRYVRALLP